MKQSVPLVFTLLFVIFTSSCEKQPSTESTASAGSLPATKSTDAGNFKVTLSSGIAPIKEHQHFSLHVKVDPTKAGQEFKVLVNADMPAHGHGMNTQPEISQIKPNEYRVDGMLFHMTGDWVINVDVTQGETTEQALFPVHVE